MNMESYLPLSEIATLKQRAWRVHQLLNGYIRWLRERKQGVSLALHESPPAYDLTEDELDRILGAPDAEDASTLQRFNASTQNE